VGLVVAPLNLLAFAFVYWAVEVKLPDAPRLREAGPYLAPFAITSILFLPVVFSYRSYLVHHADLPEHEAKRWLRLIAFVPHAVVLVWWRVVRSRGSGDSP
jgi:hypothetical protein